MNQKELRELIEFLKEQEIVEFEMERGDFKVKVKRAGAETHVSHVVPDPRYIVQTAAPVVAPPEASQVAPAASAPAKSSAKEAAPEEGLHIVKSPIVGTYYESPSPGSPPFVKVGDTVEA